MSRVAIRRVPVSGRTRWQLTRKWININIADPAQIVVIEARARPVEDLSVPSVGRHGLI
jgi:hypothetical protein